jgi:hypothetical protein
MSKFAYHKPSNPVALCRYHNWTMSAKQVKTKGCLFKQKIGNRCPHLTPFSEHEFWQQRDKKATNKTEKSK